MKVDFYRAEVKYTGRFEDYTSNDLFQLAQARTLMQDCFYKTEEMPAIKAKNMDGKVIVSDNPCNKIATVTWAYIREEEEEEEEEQYGPYKLLH